MNKGENKMKDKTLLIMAAGMGSRFGGLKQIEPMGPNGEFLIDYSIYDAIRCGFTKVVFIIKKEIEEVFKETIGKRVEDKIKVEYVFQTLEDIPEGYTLPSDRTKPLGTSQAILAAREVIHEPFAVINADDFYDYDGFRVVSSFLDQEDPNARVYATVGYQVKNTLTEHGSVKRGVCEEQDGYLTTMVESVIERDENGTITASPLSGAPSFTMQEDQYVSMNLFGFFPSIFNYLMEQFPTFLEENKDNLDKCEFLISESLHQMIEEKKAKVKVLPTVAVWQGVTYKEDKEAVVKALQKMCDENKYPQSLWKKENE